MWSFPFFFYLVGLLKNVPKLSLLLLTSVSTDGTPQQHYGPIPDRKLVTTDNVCGGCKSQRMHAVLQSSNPQAWTLMPVSCD